MARIEELGGNDLLKNVLARSLQSGHINFLLGAGASLPAIPVAGKIEQEVEKLFEAGKAAEARQKLYECLETIYSPMNVLIEGGTVPAHITETLSYYQQLASIIEQILSERRTSLLHRHATLFTTNYDLFVEQACASCSFLTLNDGFQRTPRLDGKAAYSSRSYFNTVYNTGNLYDYKVEVPCLNLVKLHGSLSWSSDGDGIELKVGKRALLKAPLKAAEVDRFLADCALVLPLATKYGTTVMEQTYYELLRLYSNELDHENSLLLAFGCSFSDRHLLGITKRALQNPTLTLFVFAFDEIARESYASMFAKESNVIVVAPPSGKSNGFSQFNDALKSCLPLSVAKA